MHRLPAAVAAIFLASAAAFAAVGRPIPALVAAIAGVAYFGMAVSTSSIPAPNEAQAGGRRGAPPPFYRYADWALTTPLILYALLRGALRPDWLLLVCGADVLMIAAGYLGVLAASPSSSPADVRAVRQWFALSFAMFVPVLAAVAYGLLRTSGGKKKGASAMVLVLVVWLAYPAVYWAQHCCVSADRPALSRSTTDAITACLDVVAKVGFGILL